MPSLYLSPSTQEYNKYYDNSGSEAYYMKIIADYMEPYLTAGNVSYIRSKAKMTAGSSAAHSNEKEHGLHLSIHSNTAGMGNAGNSKGVLIYYYSGSTAGKHAADIFARNLKSLYPNPALINVIPNTTYAELNRTKAPALLVGIGFHDNPSDAEWIKNNLQAIACNLALSVTEFLDAKPTAPVTAVSEPQKTDIENIKNKEIKTLPLKINDESKADEETRINKEGIATVIAGGKRLNLRAQPSVSARILGQIPDKSILTVCACGGEWCSVRYNGIIGYVDAKYVSIKK